ncbi:hypothetical protein PENTCL1PPCAC_30737 [Pristionchus entomophagus]|uniref:ceramidase n=1 Tax=Pristionchus entomophagus TaxID=358040 RepID=A0AAV5UQN2_9BILA|nr:hypothetical protein PENTCL1PPCAC_3192 [Pristionchus entomophagus]GMT08563.1 hypothetical protein PENTCL1PPCAC_30737 [Pristionchus entomophagus]
MLSLLLPLLLLLPSTLIAAPAPSLDNPWGEYAPECLSEKPSLWDESRIVKNWYKIDLDAEAHDMWKEVANDYKDKMVYTLGVVQTMVDEMVGGGAWDAILSLMTGAPDMLTEPYKTEIKAMADLTGIQLEKLTLLNLFYEVQKACTSLIAMDNNGKTYHGRNLDFGLFFLWDVEKHTWDLTLGLRDLVVQLDFQMGGKQLFKAVTFAGHLGVLTAVRPGAYSVSTNTRFGSTLDTVTGFFEHGLDPNQQFEMYAYRDMLTKYATFEEARAYMETVPLLAMGYTIMGATNGGVIITRSATGTDHEEVIDTSKPNGWYVLQTNYDWNEPDIFLDDRTIPGNKCMQQMGRNRLTKEALFQVMSSQTTLNKSTVYTTIIEIESGELYTFLQECKDPCWFV